jgi:hypothetical protein
MQYKSLVVSSTLAISCLVFAGCKPKPVAENPRPFNPSPSARPAAPVAETLQVQNNICGKLSAEAVTQLTGIKVGPPSVTKISGGTGATRYICSYAKEGDLSILVLHMNVSFKKESPADKFQQLWDAQKADAKKVDDLDVEAYTKVVDQQPVLYVMAPDAQYWLKMGKLNQDDNKQMSQLRQAAQRILK